ncbi:leucine-rich repeat-containing protein 34 isoform X3 [Rhinoraja longicauda]
MSTPSGLKASYLEACNELQMTVNPYVEYMVEQATQSSRSFYDEFTVILNGNSRLYPVQRVTDEDAAVLLYFMKRNCYITGLDLRFNKITNCGAEQFAKFLLETEALIDLNLMCNDIGSNGAEWLAKALQEEMTVHMADMLHVNQTLQELHLARFEMKDFGVQQLCEQLVQNKTLRYLDLHCNHISCDGARHLAELLKHNTPLKILDLSANRIGDDGLVYISEALRYLNDQLLGLSVTRNSITGIGLVAFANILKSNTTLRNVYIWGNELDDAACIEFANLLKVGRLKPKQTDVSPYWIDGRVYLAELSHGLQMFYYWIPQYGDRDEAACNASTVLLQEPQSSMSQINMEDIESSSTEKDHSSGSISGGSSHMLTI